MSSLETTNLNRKGKQKKTILILKDLNKHGENNFDSRNYRTLRSYTFLIEGERIGKLGFPV